MAGNVTAQMEWPTTQPPSIVDTDGDVAIYTSKYTPAEGWDGLAPVTLSANGVTVYSGSHGPQERIEVDLRGFGWYTPGSTHVFTVSHGAESGEIEVTYQPAGEPEPEPEPTAVVMSSAGWAVTCHFPPGASRVGFGRWCATSTGDPYLWPGGTAAASEVMVSSTAVSAVPWQAFGQCSSGRATFAGCRVDGGAWTTPLQLPATVPPPGPEPEPEPDPEPPVCADECNLMGSGPEDWQCVCPEPPEPPVCQDECRLQGSGPADWECACPPVCDLLCDLTGSGPDDWLCVCADPPDGCPEVPDVPFCDAGCFPAVATSAPLAFECYCPPPIPEPTELTCGSLRMVCEEEAP